MEEFVIKGTIMGLSHDQWLNDNSFFVSTLHTILGNWQSDQYETNGRPRLELSKPISKQFGEVRQATIAMENDLHNLSICYNQFLYLQNDVKISRQMKNLFYSNLTESYFTNIRSIYDYISHFPRIITPLALLEKGLPQISSFNDLIKFADTDARAKKTYGEDVITAILNGRDDLKLIRNVRDSIIHHGKEAVVSSRSDGTLVFKIPSKIGFYESSNLLPDLLSCNEDEYPLMQYLRNITLALLRNMENLGNAVGHLFINQRPGSEGFYLYGLSGICMKPFMEYLFAEGGRPEFYGSIQNDGF